MCRYRLVCIQERYRPVAGSSAWNQTFHSGVILGVRRSIVAMLGSVLVAACTSTTVDETTTSAGAPRSTVTSTTASLPPPTLTEGRLPDGRDFVLESDVAIGNPEGVFAVIEVNLEEAPFSGADIGCPTCFQPVLGITTFRLGSGRAPVFEHGVYEASSGDWTMRIEVYEDILEAWGDGIEADLLQHIRPVNGESGLPSFELSGPFLWAEDTDVPAFMEVFYDTFVVRRGCGESGVSCSSSGSVQVIPIDEVVAPAPSWDHSQSIAISDGP